MVCSPQLCKGSGLRLFLPAQNLPAREKIAAGAMFSEPASPQALKPYLSVKGLDGRVRREGKRKTRAVLHAASPCKLTRNPRASVCAEAVAVEMGSQLSALRCVPCIAWVTL